MIFPNKYEQPLLASLVTVLLATLILFLVSQTINSFKEGSRIGKTDTANQITVQGSGTTDVKPDIASLSVTVETSASSSNDAKNENAETMNSLLEKFKTAGIDEKDLQTESISTYQDTIWDPEKRTYVDGEWIATQTLSVTIRDTENVATIVDLASEHEHTSYYGPNFRVDDTASFAQDARKEAIKQARADAQEIADALGVRLGDVVGYDEWESGDDYYYYDYPRGAGVMAEEAAVSPTFSPGTEEVTINVSVTYQLVP